jgi:pimeloyl-ACP methyl ester carboxylesterase
MSRSLTLAGIDLALEEQGDGPPLLFLHAGEGLAPERPWLALLARRFRVIAPWHPGWGGSALPDRIGSVEDLACLYLDLADALRLDGACLAGACFGGWIAAELAVRQPERFARLALIAPLGVKFGAVTERDIADMHAMGHEDYLAAAWADPARGEQDTTVLADDALTAIARGREAFALFGWKPYMHNPRLRHWLHRIRPPTLLLWGAADRIVTPAYGARWQEALPDARLEIIPDAGHFPLWEQPEPAVAALTRFLLPS